MKRAMLAAVVLTAGMWALNAAADEKPAKPAADKADKAEKPAEVKLQGTLVCASCALNEGKKCANVLQVKEKEKGSDKEKVVNYYLVDKGTEETYHDKVCGGGKLEGVTVTGTVAEKDGKKTVKTPKVEK